VDVDPARGVVQVFGDFQTTSASCWRPRARAFNDLSHDEFRPDQAILARIKNLNGMA